MSIIDNLPPQYLNLIRCGAAPSPADTPVFEGHIRQDEDELASVSAEIVQLSARLQQLTEKQAQLRRYLKCYKSLFAPIRRVPPELLSEIFIHCLDRHGVRPFTEEAPLLLLRVNARWRDVASKTPQLWANLAIGSDISHNLLSAWLARSTCPLDIAITDRLAPLSRSPFQSMASSDLVALCRRLHSLTIEIEADGNTPVPDPLFPVDPVDMPFLEKYRVFLPGIFSRNLSNLGILPFALAPRLHRCHFRTCEGLSKDTPFPWSQLTNLTLTMHHQTNILEILRECTNLINLEITRCRLYGSASQPISFRPVFLPHLSVFDMSWTIPSSGITCFDLPSLQELKLSTDGVQHRFLPQRCAGQIKRFELYDADHLSTEEVENRLALMPELRHLHLGHNHILPILSRSVAHNGRSLLPKLQSIDTDRELSLADLVDFIKARWNPHGAHSESIQEICATPMWSEAPSAEQLCLLRQCLDEGLIIRYECGMFHHACEWPVRKGDEERGMEEFGWTYPSESVMA